MSDGHRHRTIRLRRGGCVLRLLRSITIRTTADQVVAERSRFVYSPTLAGDRYRMSLLGLLHGLVGLTIETKP